MQIFPFFHNLAILLFLEIKILMIIRLQDSLYKNQTTAQREYNIVITRMITDRIRLHLIPFKLPIWHHNGAKTGIT